MLQELKGNPYGSGEGREHRKCTLVNMPALRKFEVPQMGVSQESNRTALAQQLVVVERS